MMETKGEHLLQVSVSVHTSAVCSLFSENSGYPQDIPYVSVWITAICCVCICMCDFMLCGSMCRCLCVWLFICLCTWQDLDQDVESYFSEVLATVEQSTEGNRGEQGQIRQKLQELYSQILCDSNKGALQKYSILFYSILYTLSIFVSILCLTSTNQHFWQTPSVPK